MPTEVQLMRRFLDSADDVLPRPFSGFNDWDGVFFIHYMAVFFVLFAELDSCFVHSNSVSN